MTAEADQGAGAERGQQATRFLLLYALAAAGGAIAYVPFLTILLPIQVTTLAADADVAWLAYATFTGAVAASLANIAFGWLSDRTRTRRKWIVAGLVVSSVLLVLTSRVENVGWLIVLVAVWQVALNMMLAPLAAWAGDSIPDGQKGTLGGLLSFSPAAGALAAAFITLPGFAGPEGRLWLVAALVALCVLPAVLIGHPRRLPHLAPEAPGGHAAEPVRRERSRIVVVRMWLARLLVQTCEAALFAFLYFWFRTVDPAMTDARVAQIFSAILIVSVPLAIAIGRWTDVHARPFLPLCVTAACSTVGLVMMALSTSLGGAVTGYLLFGVTASVFLSLHTGQTLRVLPQPRNRGRDLGIFNLTNTGPSLIMPWLALAMIPVFGFAGLFFVLAGCALLAALLLMNLPRQS
ncbi:MFS transporter [Alteriqipengyuania lutimaris]|uniref:MFS transporter n=1 Tax=Alteriqipengyuania lutimaris TaxID=1538146 RepID=A0A395LLB7_9SPHN|nr:MFS transporter [Alteriqipengyuania lutimaris]MBB3033843.1 MFS family permease [Alteriqipengyuania lutimaris]RDS77187.1 MFS transporter [Alteriqipengyuania lutimaris]